MTHRACYARAGQRRSRRPSISTSANWLMGGDGAGTSLSEMPILLRNLLGMKFKVIDGYKGSVEIVLAMARNEVAGICQTTMAFAQAGQHLLDSGVVRMLFTTERERVAKYNVPTIFEHAKTEEQRSILAFHASSLETGRPWLAPPNVPAERVQALRRAYDATMKDRAFLEEAKLRKMGGLHPRSAGISSSQRAIARSPDSGRARRCR